MATPVSPYFGPCGGCSLQDVDYELQLRAKRDRLAQVVGAEVEAVGSEPYGYRNRMDFVFRPDGLGIREKGVWWSVLDIASCAIAEPRINALLAEAREGFRGPDVFDLRKKTGTFRYAVIRSTRTESSVSIVLNRESPALDAAMERVRAFAERTTATHVLATRVQFNRDVSISDDYTVVKGRDQMLEILLDRRFHFPIQGFFQVNRAQAERLHRWVRQRLPGGEVLLDLFSGVGPFGILNADRYREVVMVEGVAGCVESAARNAAANGASNARAVLLDARKLATLSLGHPLHLVVDPPRGGMHPKALDQILRLEPEVIVYVSCNLRHLKTDLERLTARYRIARAAMFDLFPQTPHQESVVVLERA